jgi:hypothetical protein
MKRSQRCRALMATGVLAVELSHKSFRDLVLQNLPTAWKYFLDDFDSLESIYID